VPKGFAVLLLGEIKMTEISNKKEILKDFYEKDTKITSIEVKHIKESLRSLYEIVDAQATRQLSFMLDARLSQIDMTEHYGKYNALVSLSNKIVKMLKTIDERSDELDLKFHEIFLEKGA